MTDAQAVAGPGPDATAPHGRAAPWPSRTGWGGTLRRGPDSVTLRRRLDTAARGGQDRLLRGGDAARRRRYRAYGMPGQDHPPTRFLPRLQREGGAEPACRIMVDHPARWLDRPPPP